MELSKSAFIILALLLALIICTAGCSKAPRDLEYHEEITPSSKICGDYVGCSIGTFLHDGFPSAESINSYEKVISREVAVVMWFQDFTLPFQTATCEMIYSHGCIPMIAWEPWIGGNFSNMTYSLDAINSGTWDTYIRDFAIAAKAWGKPLFIRWAHEMNGNWYPWSGIKYGTGSTATDKYKNAWRRIYNIFATVEANNVTWAWCPNNESVPADPWNNAVNYYPGDAYVDWMGFDGYSKPETSWGNFEALFLTIYATLCAISTFEKPILIGEMSRDEPDPNTSENGKSAWITDTFNKIKSSGYQKIKLYVWFNLNKYEAPKMRYWQIDNWPLCMISFEAAMKDPYYISIIH
jgi:hypothetical protein